MPRSVAGLVPGLVVARRRWSAEEARAVLKRLVASGLTVREFAARNGLETQRLYRWRAQLRFADPAPGFIEIKSPVGAAIEVVLRSGHVVRVRDGFDAEALRRVVAALDGVVAAC